MADQITGQLSTTAFVFRGYNVTNLGRTPELLNHPRFGGYVARRLEQCGRIASDVMHRRIDLLGRVSRGEETDLDSYSDAIALIMAVEMAHVDILEQEYHVQLAKAQYLMGYSLGELTALVAGQCLSLEDALTIPLSLSTDTAKLAPTCTLAVVFCRKKTLSADRVHHLCQEINAEGKGLIGISAILSPNSLIVIGEEDTTTRLHKRLQETIADRVHLKKNPHKWPPMHTPIVWREHINSRASLLMSQMKSGFTAPKPPVLSLVTGACSYNDSNVRDLICQWVDKPQHLWQAVYHTLSSGTESLIHLGPEPNIVPATYSRLAENVEAQVKASISTRALSTLVYRPWLNALIGERAYLLRAPTIKQTNLEDWLIDKAS
ncbi:Malonyl CoA-acyl carrier protein transacylase [Bremerella volcania]|uniref:[acyl-carrier-protein] S-malonyltransferase n=1 Tax=Bremerella volcania TaxID=2527984 RepID=A0A518C8K7_9BACT|nr:ACP S-malonyltransferase [Bremerella volcania]QDU75566.1 Malonyl CoA-acyl carrier protein transacylase [Bremerella volcania]